jgi:hemoglobin
MDTMTKPDIQNHDDIRRLIDTFYNRVTADDLLGPIFNDVANVDWAHHLPVMYNFWEFLLLGGTQYTGNPIQKHHDLHARHALSPELFDRWVAIFGATVDDLFAGPTADSAKLRALAIGESWKPKFGPHHGIGIIQREQNPS